MTISPRDVQQVFSFAVSIVTLVIIVIKLRGGFGSFRVWFPFLLITTFTIVYYILVFIDTNLSDIINAGDWSATLRLSVQIALLLYA